MNSMKSQNIGDKIKSVCINYTIIPILVLLFIVFGAISPSTLNPNNLVNILYSGSFYGIMALGLTMVLLAGFFDLSSVSIFGFCANFVVYMIPFVGVPLAILLSLLAGALFGLLDGLIVAKLKINAFMGTLAIMLGVRGLLFVLTEGEQLYCEDPTFYSVSEGTPLGIPNTMVIYILLTALLYFVLKKTMHGRNTYAVGSNQEAAHNAGINVSKVVIINYIILGLGASLAGILTASRMNSTTALLGWPNATLDCLTCVCMGGTSLSTGGRGGVLFTFAGVYAFFLVRNGINSFGVASHFIYITTGAILLIIVAMDAFMSTRRELMARREQMID